MKDSSQKATIYDQLFEALAKTMGVDMSDTKRIVAVRSMQVLIKYGVVTELIDSGRREMEATGMDINAEAEAMTTFLASRKGATNGTMMSILLATLRAILATVPGSDFL